MYATGFYPVLMSSDVGAAAGFYRDLLGFQTTFETDWYVSLRLDAFELAILAHDHPTVPGDYRALPKGVIVNLEVEDVEGELDKVTGPDGEWVNPTLTADIAAGLDAARRAKQGEDL